MFWGCPPNLQKPGDARMRPGEISPPTFPVESGAFSSILRCKYYSLATDRLDLNFISDSVDGVRLVILNFEVTVKGISEFAETSCFRDDFNARRSASISGCGDQEGPFCSQSVK
jgi:hypothetical protein